MNPAEIEQYLIPNAGQSFKGIDFNDLCKPGVYMFIQKGKPLYIGMGINALARCSQQRHRRAYVRMEADEVRIFPCTSVEAAKQLELYLVGRLRTIFNTQNKSSLVRQRLGIRNVSAVDSSVTVEHFGIGIRPEVLAIQAQNTQ